MRYDINMKSNQDNVHRETEVSVISGWFMLPIVLLIILGSIALFIFSIAAGDRNPLWGLFIISIIGEIIGIIMLIGFFTLQPNEARVLILFGEYRGTVKQSGFHWGNPFYSNGQRILVESQIQTSVPGKAVPYTRAKIGRNKISLRARTHNVEKLKVNDKRGNPIEIGAVVIWRVEDTAQAMFDVDDYEKYVHTQSESALRHLASLYSYDHGEDNEITLRSGVEEISTSLKRELQERLQKAGVVVEETRLTHLAYAPEIAQAMLRRQQAEAVIAARQKIVQGAVSMVEMALRELAEKQVLQLDDERKAAMVSNLMVVLCGENETQPVINTGTLYT